MFGQHPENVVELLALIERIGFNEIHFRFAAQGKAANGNWTEWKADQFNENWAFVDSVRDLVADNTSLAVVFDLALEHANMGLETNRLRQLYVRRKWRLYTEAHGPNDSCAFSIIHGGD